MDQPTHHEICQHHSASLHSVDLINALTAKTRAENAASGSYGSTTEEVESTLEGNKAHLELQMSKGWFTGSLSAGDTTSINSAISTAGSY
jgi:hypothetical protein